MLEGNTGKLQVVAAQNTNQPQSVSQESWLVISWSTMQTVQIAIHKIKGMVMVEILFKKLPFLSYFLTCSDFCYQIRCVCMWLFLACKD